MRGVDVYLASPSVVDGDGVQRFTTVIEGGGDKPREYTHVFPRGEHVDPEGFVSKFRENIVAAYARYRPLV